ncbi:IS91 family transposase [Arhodomonas sp. AD133]|uniref:IS91 family transposase n=1 Tax=Arhodomonas sp. AD133 TaxID=3415009 RepID=UPI003EBDE3F2
MAESTDLQAVLARFLPELAAEQRLDGQRQKVSRHLGQCRTPALGGMHWQCDRCAYAQPIYFACRDRHCPRCQQRASRRWAERQSQTILPVAYYHLVFTLPHGLNGWAQLHPAVLYDSLFAAAAGTLKAFAADPKRLGGELGFTAVLHTWGQTLTQHIHLHCLVPGGVLTPEGRWRTAKGHYLFPVRALARQFRGRLASLLRRAARTGALSRVAPADVDHRLAELMRTEVVVYAKPCLGQAETVVGYLARYSHRIAISNARILGIDGESVAFRYTDYADGHRAKVMHLAGVEFVRRFLLHVLPRGFMRIRHYGFLANRCRRAKLARIGACLARPEPTAEGAAAGRVADTEERYPCPACGTGALRPGALLPAPALAPPRRESG